MKKNLARRELKLEISDKALSLVADLGYDPQFGARPLKRVIETELVNELALQVLSSKFVEGDTVFIDADNKGFIFSEEGYKGDGSTPTANGNGAGKKDTRDKKVAQLKKATQDVNDLVKDIKDEDDDDDDDENGSSAPPDTQLKKE